MGRTLVTIVELLSIINHAAKVNPDFELSDKTEVGFTTYAEVSKHGMETKSWSIEEVITGPGGVHLIGGPFKYE